MQVYEISQVRAELEAFIDREKISQASLSRALGVSASAISLFLKDKYAGKSEDLAEKIKLYIKNFSKARASRQREVGQEEKIFESKDKRMGDFVISEAIENKEIAIIIGEAGSGKSTIAKGWSKSHPNVVLLEATLHTTAGVLLRELCERFGVSGGANLHESVSNISKYLKNADVVLMIDEAEHLPLRALEDLRRIWDFSGVPLVLFGTEILLRNLMGKRGELRQLYSRIGGKYKMKGLEREECTEVFCEEIYSYTLGNFRASSKLYKRATRLAELHKESLSPEIIANAVNMVIL
ncbi:AAA family ATPase [Helicobacter cholecystus]|uniref:AAA family ATPase n=1 Tax=Helicobacter cholecystus TaxID=45498 RepID=UPI002738F73D|nr:AAA family ATPase [Helicobacter cholecystus]